MMMFSRPGSKGQAWHQDCAPEDPAQFNLNRLVYTHTIDESIGGQTVVMPGTHKKGLLPTGGPHADLENQVVISPLKGTPEDITDICVYRNMRYRFSNTASPDQPPRRCIDVAEV